MAPITLLVNGSYIVNRTDMNVNHFIIKSTNSATAYSVHGKEPFGAISGKLRNFWKIKK